MTKYIFDDVCPALPSMCQSLKEVSHLASFPPCHFFLLSFLLALLVIFWSFISFILFELSTDLVVVFIGKNQSITLSDPDVFLCEHIEMQVTTFKQVFMSQASSEADESLILVRFALF